MKRLRFQRFAVAVLGAIALHGLAATSAQGTVLSYSFEGADSGTPDFTTVGDASFASDGALTPTDRLRLTSSGPSQTGSAWLNTMLLDPTANWSATYRSQITFRSGIVDEAGRIGGDEFGLFLQTEGTANEGSTTGPFLSINFDTFQNSGEGSENSVEVFTSAGQAPGVVDVPPMFLLDPIGERDAFFNINVSYDSTLTQLTVEIVGDPAGLFTSVDLTYSNTFNIDLGAEFGSSLAFVGFTGRTGASFQNQDVLSFGLDGTITVVPEPSTLALAGFGIAGAGLVALRRRRRNATTRG